MIRFESVTKIYSMGRIGLTALDSVGLQIKRGEFVAIMGPSGSGKSTLLNLIGCLDVPTQGHYYLNNKDVSKFNVSQLADVRNSLIGFIFQNFNLLNYLDCTGNIELPLIYSGRGYTQETLLQQLDKVNLRNWAHHKPNELSGGQMQRIAIARALVNDPPVLLADEPTGNLDSKTGREIMELLNDLNKEGITIILITHDINVAHYAKRLIKIKDGKIISDKAMGKKTKEPSLALPLIEKRRKLLSYRKLVKNVSIALKSIVTKKLRTFLTTLGILIGVASVVSMISIGEGAKKKITEDIKQMGANVLFIQSGSGRRGRMSQEAAVRNKLTLRDADFLEKNSKYIDKISPFVRSSATVSYKNNNARISIQGANIHFPEISNYEIKFGRFFDKQAVNIKERVAVIGQTVVDNLFEGKNPVGSYIKINKINFLVIGTFEPKGSSGWGNSDDIVVIPVTTAQKRVFGSDDLSSINISVKDENMMNLAEEEATKLLKISHGLSEDKDPDFQVRSQLEILERVQSTTKIFTLLLGGIASISLLVGGIGIMNIMLVSVMERIKEIGLRKAVGAQRRDILYQFLIESIIVCFMGGLFGVILGATVSKIIGALSPWNTFIPFYSILLAFGFSFIVGLFFGIYPAVKASNLKPIEALRYE
ncbi:MAG: ABC transporter permease [Spirochaetes bacterium]|nr:ABC transporter permease [Spirochaetota bacterium]